MMRQASVGPDPASALTAEVPDEARWIGLALGQTGFPVLRREFDWTGTGSVLASINVLGLYELFVNGLRAGDRVLDPPVSNYRRRSFVVAYDITASLQPGRNTIGLQLGRGWYQWSGPDPRIPYPGVVHSSPLARAWLTGEGENHPLLVTDRSWRTRPGAISQVGSWFYADFGGERCDARRAQFNWSCSGFDDRNWQPATEVDVPSHTVSRPVAPSNRVGDALPPTDISLCEDGEERIWQIDFGTTITGWLRLALNDVYDPGHAIKVEYTDSLEYEQFDPYGQRDTYICRGQAGESFTNHFNYHTFRWVRIRGLRKQPHPEEVVALPVTADMHRAGRFSCDNALLNRIHDMTERTLRCLTLNGVQVDCPHRERLGYGGDGTASLDSTLYLFRAETLYRHWIELWCDELRPDGGLPHTAPCPLAAGGGPIWCGFPLTAAWKHYVHYGETNLLQTAYPMVRSWLEYVARHMQDGILRRWPDTDYRQWYLGDWLPPNGVDATDRESIDLINNCFLVQCYDRMHSIAGILAHPTQAIEYASRAAALRRTIHETFYHAQTGVYADGDQLDLAYPLLTGSAPPALRPKLMAKLESELRRSGRARIGTGLVGTFVLLELLSEAGRNDLLYEMIATEAYPGWGHMLARGATANWESWDGRKGSRTHNTFNSVGAWFYRTLAGILPDPAGPGFRRFRIRPQPVHGISHVNASHESTAGLFSVDWEWTNRIFTLRIDTPDGSDGIVYVPTSDPTHIRVDGPAHITGTDSLGIYRYAAFHCKGGQSQFQTTLV